MKKIELLLPTGSMACLKAAVSAGANSVYLGLNKFNARQFATNFNEDYLKQAVQIAKSNNVKIYLAMNTLIKNSEIKDFFNELKFAYENGIDSVILQEISLIPIIKENFPELKIHVSTQAGIMNSLQIESLKEADRVILARELDNDNINSIRKNSKKELEIFVHGALCVSISGSCLFSSFIGARSGNRGKCAQPCRKKYTENQKFSGNKCYLLSTKELCLIKKLPVIIKEGIDCIKIEGRMRTPYYVHTVGTIYKKAIDDYYNKNFHVNEETVEKLKNAFNREFTEGKFSKQDVFNRIYSAGESKITKTYYDVKVDNKINILREAKKLDIPIIKKIDSKQKKLIVRVYNKNDAMSAIKNGADIIVYDIFSKDFNLVNEMLKDRLYASIPRIIYDSNIKDIIRIIDEKKPFGIFSGNSGILNLGLKVPIILDYNINVFNDFDVEYYNKQNSIPIISPELSIKELREFNNKNFIVFIHGKIRLMTLAHELKQGVINDEKGFRFIVNNIFNGSEILNEKELGFFNKAKNLLNSGINQFYIDTENNASDIVRIYREILDGKTVDVTKIKNNYVLGWINNGVV